MSKVQPPIDVPIDSNEKNRWICYSCASVREKVLRFAHLGEARENRYICADCLWRRVRDGELFVATLEQVEGLPAAEAALTEEAQVIVTDDGTMVHEGTEFAWQ